MVQRRETSGRRLQWHHASGCGQQLIRRQATEPITESEHRRLVEETRAEMVPVADLAETLVERYDGWTEADMEPRGEEDERVVKDKAWNRMLAEKKRELTRLAEDGTLAGKRRGRGLLINNGSFYDWLGEPVPVCPDWGRGYDVLPDDQADRVESLKKERLRAQEAVAGSPISSMQRFLEEQHPGSPSGGSGGTRRRLPWPRAFAKGCPGAGRSSGRWKRCSMRWPRSSTARTPSFLQYETSSTRRTRSWPSSPPCSTLSTWRSTSPSRMRSGWRSSGSGCSARTRSTLCLDGGRTCQKFRHLDAFETVLA